MPTPKLKHSELLNQLASIVNSDNVLGAFAMARYAQQCDALMTTNPVEAHVVRMLLDAMRADIDSVVAFGKRAERLLLSSAQQEVNIYNFLMALLKVGIYQDFDVSAWIDRLTKITSTKQGLEEVYTLELNFGLLDRVVQHIGGGDEVMTMTQHAHTRELAVLARWTEISRETQVDEHEFARLQSLVRQSYVKRFNRSVTRSGYDIDEDGTIFCYIYAPDDLAVDDVVQFNWDVEDLLAQDGSPLLKYLAFDTQYH